MKGTRDRKTWRKQRSARKFPRSRRQALAEVKSRAKIFPEVHIVLYFYPKDDTPGCTLEGQDFRDRHGDFKRLKMKVFGVSRDSVASHEKFREKYSFPFDLISDPDERLCKQFDVIREKNMYGKKVLGRGAQHILD